MERWRRPGWIARAASALAACLALAAVAAAGAASDDRASCLPLVQEPELLWSFGPLEFESEPLVADGRVLAAGRDPTGRRALVVLDAASGRLLSRTLFPASQPLAFAAAGERVAVRVAPERVELLRVRGTRLLAERSLVHDASLSAPVLDGAELLLREGDELALYDLGRQDALWRARVPGAFHGAPVARGRHVFAGWYEANGTAHLAWIERTSGAVLGDAMLGRGRAGRIPEGRDALRVVAHAGAIFVELSPPLPSTAGRELAWSRVPFDGARHGSPTLHDFLAAPLETDEGWVAPERAADGATRWVLARRGPPSDARERMIELAAPDHHAWLASVTTPASRAGRVLYLGPCAADARSLQVLWRRATSPDFRAVPVDGGLLVVEGTRLSLLGGALPAPDSERERVQERVASLERDLGEQLARVASQALRAGDAELATRLVTEAEVLGASGRNLSLVRSEAQRIAGPKPEPRASQRRPALLAEEEAAREQLLRELAEAARAAGDARAKRAFLDELFARAPEHPAGLAELRRLLPAGAPLAAGEGRAWLEFLELARACPVELVSASEAGRTPTPEETRLAAERETWRPDALGYRSERLLVITAGTPPDAVARTLRAGELVCDVLERIFGGSRAAPGRLELVLYPTRAEYLEHSDSDLGGLESVLGFTAGHFDLGEELSRLFLPDGDEDGARLLGVSAHELTHHWLATRSRFGAPRSAGASPGFWIVEAVATWAEELRLDPLARTWSTAPARAASLDTLVNAGPRDLIPWRTLLACSFDDYCKLETRTTCTLGLDWQLGAHAPRSPMQLFYAQGGALAHYLYEAEGGAHRELFLRAVEGYYRGQPVDVAGALRTTPEDLGERVRVWAREVTGREPDMR